MKKTLLVLLSVILVGLALNVQAANVDFNPGLVRFQVPPGQADRADINVNATSSIGFPLSITVGSMVFGNLPSSWFRPVMANLVFEPDGTASSSLQLDVIVPAGALAGTYNGVLMPEATRGSEPVSSRGIYVIIEITPQDTCSAAPVFKNVEIGPQEIWAPTGRNVDIHISGSVIVDANCNIGDFTAGYSLEDNAGPVSGDLVLDGQGNFSQEITVSVSRNGEDNDGRTYNGKLFAAGSGGNNGELEFFVTVLHDKGKKNGHKK